MHRFLRLFLAIAIPQLAGALGALFTGSKISTWYASLVRPSLAPPDWVFGVVWPILYLCMGVALFLIWNSSEARSIKKPALKIFGVQLLLNAIWSPVFFGAQSIAGGLVVIALLWLCIAWTIMRFKQVSQPAAWLLVPYFLWVSFATYLNAMFLLLN